ncbi:MAG: acylphosphatase [Hydrogenothermaceae bacterium]|nr:acylphosphatase [Hydrogenothermaceae bacterium]
MTIHLIFYGKVQGVGFRKFVKKKAEEFCITGYVKNLRDGTVEVIAQGEEEILKRFLEEIKDGPERAIVEKFQQKNIEKGDYHEFKIKY